jgi:ADP-heptose:LPS heptosyltransferase
MDAQQLLKKLVKKIARGPARVRLFIFTSYAWAIHQATMILTERYWLIDYLPQLGRSHGGVMLVRLDLIGDFIIWLDAAKEFRALYPGQRIVLFANATWANVAQRLPYWDEVLSIDVPRLRTDDWYRLCVLLQIQRRHFDIAIQSTYSREYVGDLCVRAANFAQRIAHIGDDNNIQPVLKAKSDVWYTNLVPEKISTIVELTHNANLIRHLGKSEFKSRAPRLDRLEELPPALKIDTPYCVIVPGASWAPKMWPVSNFGHLAQQISQELKLTIVLCGTSAEKKICDQVASSTGATVVNLAGKTTLIEMIELIRSAQLVIANDSAAIHIAAATNTPAVCILGGGHFGRFLPYQPEISKSSSSLPKIAFSKMDCYGCRWTCQYLESQSTGVVPCISQVDPSIVLKSCYEQFP